MNRFLNPTEDISPNRFLAPQESQPFDNTQFGIALDTVEGLFTPAPYLKVVKDLAQGVARSFAATGLTAALDFSTLRGKANPSLETWHVPPVLQPIFGTEKIDNLGSQVLNLQNSIRQSPFANKTGLSKFAFPLSFAGVTIGTGLDLSLFAGGEENLIKTLARETNPERIFPILTKLGVQEDLAKNTARIFAGISDKNEIKDVLNNLGHLADLEKISSRTAGMAEEKNLLPSEETALVPKNTAEAVNAAAERAKAGEDFGPRQTSEIPGLKTAGDVISKDPIEIRSRIEMNQESLGTIQDLIDEHPGKILQRFVSKNKGRFEDFSNPELAATPGAAKRIMERNDRVWKAAQQAFSDNPQYSDKFDNPDAIREVISDYQNLQQREKDLLQEGKTLKNDLRTAEKNAPPLEKPYAFDENVNPLTGNVNPPVVRGGIKPPELSIQKWQDRPTVSLARETFERNIKRVAPPEDAAKLQEFIVDPIRVNETKRIEYTDKLKAEIKGFVDELGIKAGSKEDALIQQFGEKEINLDQLKMEAPHMWQNIEEAAKFFRNKYDELLTDVNESRQAFGYKPIPKRDDYFRHFREISNVINQIGVLFREQDLPTEISGITDIFKPGKPFSTAELKRRGDLSTISAIKGMDNYIESISKQIFHIDSVQRVRSLEKYIRKTAEHFSNMPGEKLDLASFVANVNEYGNLLAGKSAKLDRAVEGTIGRKVFKAASMIKSQAGTALIAGNISSALTNFIPFTESLATTAKIPAIKGLLESMITPLSGETKIIDGIRSSFLTRRFPSGKIAPSFGDNAKEKLGWLFDVIDRFTAKSVVGGKYYEGLSKGLSQEEAMKAADTYAGKVLTDRSLGQLPNLFGSKTAGFITQFQTEVNNMYSFLRRDIPEMAQGNKLKILNYLGQFILFSYFMNDAYQEVTGRRPTLDPLYAAMTLVGATDASKNLPLKDKAIIAGKDIAGNLPFGNLIPGLGSGGRFPVASLLPDIKKLSEGDLTELLNPVSLQLKKTIQGLSAYDAGQVRTPSGKSQRYKVEQNLPNFLRAALFGKSSFPEAQNYFNSLNQPKKKTISSSNRFLK